MATTRRRFNPTVRDRQIVTTVYTHRALTSDQITLLFWGHPKSTSRSRLRLRLLAEHGYLERAEQPVALSEGRKPLVYFLAKGGVDIVAEEFGIDVSHVDWKVQDNNVKWLFLEHLLATNDIRTSFEVAVPQTHLTLEEWIDDKSLARLSIKDTLTVRVAGAKPERMTVGPDGYVSFRTADGKTLHRAFIEADRATVPLTRWSHKVRKYLIYFRSSAFRERYRAQKPFRVLTATTSMERLTNMKQITEDGGGNNWFWFTTYDAIRDPQQILHHPIWFMAGHDEPIAFPYPLDT